MSSGVFITTNPLHTNPLHTGSIGTLQISGGFGSNGPVTMQVTSQGALRVHLDSLPDFPESWQIIYFAAAALQGMRSAGDKRDAAEIAAQAYKDAVALMNAMKQVKAVTNALTPESEPWPAEAAAR